MITLNLERTKEQSGEASSDGIFVITETHITKASFAQRLSLTATQTLFRGEFSITQEREVYRSGNGRKTFKLTAGVWLVRSLWRSAQFQDWLVVVDAVGNCACTEYAASKALEALGVDIEKAKQIKTESAEKKAVIADAIIESLGLPDLAGTEKQVKWALDIRAKFAADLQTHFAKHPSAWELVKAALRAKTEARFFIDQRSSTVRAFGAGLFPTDDAQKKIKEAIATDEANARKAQSGDQNSQEDELSSGEQKSLRAARHRAKIEEAISNLFTTDSELVLHYLPRFSEAQLREAALSDSPKWCAEAALKIAQKMDAADRAEAQKAPPPTRGQYRTAAGLCLVCGDDCGGTKWRCGYE